MDDVMYALQCGASLEAVAANLNQD